MVAFPGSLMDVPPSRGPASKVKILAAVVNRSSALVTITVKALTSHTMTVNPQIICSGLWRWLQGTGLERFEFLHAGDEWIFRGTILTLAGNMATEARYELACDSVFRTRRADISVRDAGGERTLQLAAENGRWYTNGHENQTVQGALDIDLGWSTCTNTLPIRR